MTFIAKSTSDRGETGRPKRTSNASRPPHITSCGDRLVGKSVLALSRQVQRTGAAACLQAPPLHPSFTHGWSGQVAQGKLPDAGPHYKALSSVGFWLTSPLASYPQLVQTDFKFASRCHSQRGQSTAVLEKLKETVPPAIKGKFY